MGDKGDKLSITVIDSSGSNSIPVTVPKTTTADQLVGKLKNTLNYPRDAEYHVELKRTNTILDPQSTFEQADVQDNDILRLRVRPDGGI